MTTKHLRSAAAVVTLLVTASCHSGESTGPDGAVSFTKLSAGLGFTCALDTEGTAYCWGQNDRGQLGDATTTDRLAPVKVSTDVKFTTITSSTDHTCALTSEGQAYCWGSNAFKKLGAGTSTTANFPIAVATDLRFISVAAALQNTCATTSNLEVYCWGRIAQTDQFFDDLFYTGPQPAKVGSGMVAVVAGTDGGYCSVDSAGLAYCWNLVFTYPPAGPVIPPIGQAVSSNLHFATLRRGYSHYCGVLNEGSLECWGVNAVGQVGIGNVSSSIAAPTPINSSLRFTAVAAGGTGPASGHSCGLTQDGSLHCWGYNASGQLGIGSLISTATPTPVSANLKFTIVRAGGLHTCGIATNGRTYCWGDNTSGALGIGSTANASSPKPVSDPN